MVANLGYTLTFGLHDPAILSRSPIDFRTDVAGVDWCVESFCAGGPGAVRIGVDAARGGGLWWLVMVGAGSRC
jgi:hypothetical protein